PLFPDTKHIINKAAIKKMKQGVIIINTARGGLIDAEALLWGLQKNNIGAAGLDVIEGEDLLEDPLKILCKECNPEMSRLGLINNTLIDHERTIITPHNAFNTIEAVKRIITTSCENIKAFTDATPQNTVTIK
ncbi:MAG: hydroxyacid dehydrogenase, partial [Candidatus Pacebacteria bacterium CG_4_9_14_0_2_um_filter_36_8]